MIMFAWLLVFFYLIAASSAPGAQELAIEAALHEDDLRAVLSKLDFAALCQMSFASKRFRLLADENIKALYGICHNKQTFLNYSKIIHERKALVVQVAGENDTAGKISGTLAASMDYKCIQSILEARFGHCIQSVPGTLPEFYLHDVSLDILSDSCKISVLPYILDQIILDPLWIYLVRGLVDLGRFDLLSQVMFPQISSLHFCKIMSAAVPKQVIAAAAKSLQQTTPTSELSALLAYAGFGDAAASLPDTCSVPLFIVRHLHENGISIPADRVLVDGLEESSISFWMYVIEKEARELIDLVFKLGDGKSKCLAGVFYGPVPDNGPAEFDKDVYQAMLIRFRFSPICNGNVVQNYESMLENFLPAGFHSTCALLDFELHTLVDRYGFASFVEADLAMLINRIYQLKDDRLVPLIPKCIKNLRNAPKLLKRLIQTKADEAYIQPVWDSIQSADMFRTINDHSCSAPLEVLKSLVFEQSISIDNVQRMLGILEGFQGNGVKVSKEAHALYTVMFWEAPETVISHFLDQVPNDFKLDHKSAWEVLVLTEYSDEFCARLIHCLEPIDSFGRGQIRQFRPDLAIKLGLED